MTFNTDTFLPPVLAVGAQSTQNGRQQLGSGLVTHRGIIDVNCLRATGALYPQHGAGLEVVYNQASVPKRGVIQSYDRDAAAYTDLNIVAANVNLIPQGGKVTMPAGTATSQLGLYRQILTYYVPASGAWYESPVQVSATTSGGRIRATACGALYSATAGVVVYVGFMTDGTVTFDSLTAGHIPVANYSLPFSFSCYSQPSAALHRFAICLYSNGGTNSGFWAGIFTNLWIHEEKA